MNFLKYGISAFGKLLVVVSLSAAFFFGMFGVIYLQLAGGEVEIPKIVGMNFNDGEDELEGLGLRIRKIASRYSNDDPNTILEQRPRAGTTAKTGLMISVVVSESNPDGNEPVPVIKDDEEAIEEIEDLPELKTERTRKRPKTEKDKTGLKTRDIIEAKPAENAKSENDAAKADKPDTDGTGDAKKKDGAGDGKPSSSPGKTKSDGGGPAKPKADKVKPKTSGEVRPRRTPLSN